MFGLGFWELLFVGVCLAVPAVVIGVVVVSVLAASGKKNEQ
jgi:hypothetical protein